MTTEENKAEEIEITPEMIEAGAFAVLEYEEMSLSDARDLARSVLMAALSSGNKMEQSTPR